MFDILNKNMSNIGKCILLMVLILNKFSVYSYTLGPPAVHLTKNVNEGSVSFSCVVTGIDYKDHAFNHPLRWRKIQDATETSAAVFGQIESPFKQTGRYSVAYDNNKQESVFTITNLKLEDSGVYQCEVGSQKIVHVLTVIDEITSLDIYGSDNSSYRWNNVQPAVGHLEFETFRPGMIQCVAKGGYPEPTLSIKVDGLQKTGFYQHEHYCNLTGSPKGLQTFSCVTSRGDNSFTPPTSLNSKQFECKAHLSNDITDTASVTIIIKGVPSIVTDECPNVVNTQVNEKNVELKCLFMSTTAPESISWEVDNTGVYVTTEKTKSRFTAINTVKGNDKIEAKLIISEVYKEDFHKYVLKVENVNGEMNLREIELKLSSKIGASLKACSLCPSKYLVILVFLITSVNWIVTWL